MLAWTAIKAVALCTLQMAGAAMAKDLEVKRLFPNAVLIALAAPAGYAFTYSYERGYSDYFGIPPEYVTVSVEKTVAGAAGLAAFALIALFILSLFISYVPKPITGAIEQAGYSVALPFLLFLWIFVGFIEKFHGDFFWFMTITLSFQFVGCLILVASKVWGSEDAKTSSHSNVQLSKLELAILMGVGLAIASAYSYGQSQAEYKTMYLLSVRNPNLIQLAVYGDTQILAVRSSGLDGLDRHFVITKVGAEPYTDFSVAEIAPLSRSSVHW